MLNCSSSLVPRCTKTCFEFFNDKKCFIHFCKCDRISRISRDRIKILNNTSSLYLPPPPCITVHSSLIYTRIMYIYILEVEFAQLMLRTLFKAPQPCRLRATYALNVRKCNTVNLNLSLWISTSCLWGRGGTISKEMRFVYTEWDNYVYSGGWTKLVYN